MLVRTSDGDEFRSQTVEVKIPGLELSLGANHPNPFNPQTTIPYVVPPGSAPVRVRLAIYDTSGRLVRLLVDEEQTGGARDVVWRGEDSAGKTVTSVTTPDGHTLTFGEPQSSEANNPWLVDLDKVTKQ